MKRILWISDGVVATGFSTVSHSIIDNLPQDEYQIHHLAINYYGDPHPHKHLIYPAALGGDVYGINRIKDFRNKNIDMIFILNDLWIIDVYLAKIKEIFGANVPPVVVYFPVDAEEFIEKWFTHFNIVTKAVVYTKFGYNVCKKTVPGIEFDIIPHGVNTKLFFKMKETKNNIKRSLYPNKPDFYDDSFIVFNGNRNQPRKRIDISLEGFSLFAKDKPENVKYYHHAGITDMGWDVKELAKRYGIEDRFIVTNLSEGIQKISAEKLNLIYNATDVGLNTSLGEGWGLVSCEHAATGAVQVVPDNSASRELYEDCGLLIPCSQRLTMERTLTVGKLVRPEDVATKLEELYTNKELKDLLAEKCYNKFTSTEYSWEVIAKKWNEIFQEVTS